jgi:hypothetical protein
LGIINYQEGVVSFLPGGGEQVCKKYPICIDTYGFVFKTVISSVKQQVNTV